MQLMKKFLVFTISFLLTAQPLFANISSYNNSLYEKKRFFNNGQITEGAYYNDSNLVIWVQDLHMNAGVQKKIATLIEEIANKKKIDKIHTEGAAKGKIDISVLESIPKEINKKHTIDFLSKSGFLSAAEYLTIEKGFDIFGIEDIDLYVKNLKILEDILIERKSKDYKIKEIKKDTDKLLLQFLSYDTLKLKKEFKKDQNKTVLKYFNKEAPLLSYYPNLLKYTEYDAKNKQYSTSDINKEFLLCINDLKEYVPFDRYSKLLNVLNEDEQGSFSILNDAISRYAPDLFKQYHNLALFLENQKLLDSVNKIELFNEEQLFVKDILSLKSNAAIDLELLELKKAVDVLESYFAASITSTDYALLKSEKEKYEELFNKYFDGQSRDYAISLLNDEKLSSFYENNLLRDKVFAQELIEENEKSFSEAGGYEEVCANFRNFKNVKVLIAGGFHYGIIDELKASQTSYLILLPEINSLSGEYNYNDFIIYGAQTLNKLFNADFNFGSPTQVINGFFSVISAWGFLYENSDDFQRDINDWIVNCEKLEGINVDISDIENGFKVNIDYKGEVQEKDIFFDEKDEPIALGKRVNRLIERMFSGTKLAEYTTAQMLSLAFRGVNNEYQKNFERSSEQNQKQLLKWIARHAKNKLGKNTQVFVSKNPLLISDKRDWALATLTHEGGNFVLYLHESLFTDLLFENLPEDYTVKQFFSQLVKHEIDEFYAINMPDSDIGKEFKTFLDKIEGVPSSYNFHRYLHEQNINSDIFRIASRTVASILIDRASQSMYDIPLKSPKRALIAMEGQGLDFTLPVSEEKQIPKKGKRSRESLTLSPQDCEPILNEKGILLTAKSAAYYRAVNSILDSLGDQVDKEEALAVMSDTYEAAWVKLAVLKKLSEGQKIIKTNINVPGQLTWSDAVIEDSSNRRTFIHTNHIFFHEATEESKEEEGLKRFGRGSIKKAIKFLNEAQTGHVEKTGKESSDIKEALEALTNDSLSISEKKAKAVRAIKRYTASIKNPLESNGLISLVADAAQELRKDYLESMIEHLNSSQAVLQYGKVHKHIIVIDTRGMEGIKAAIKERMEELNEEYSNDGRFEFKFADEIVDIPKTTEEIAKDLNEWSSEYAKDFTYGNPEGPINSPGRILYGTIYSRYVGLLLELKSVAEMSELGYEIIKSGYEVQDESGRYVTELDIVVKDKKGKISIVECKSARSTMSFSKLLQSKVVYKLDTYLKDRDLINKKIGEPFDEVIFIMDVGSKQRLVGRLATESKRLSAIYGFPVKFLFFESNPNTVKEYLNKVPKPLSLLDPLMKTRSQKLVAAVFAPIWEALFWVPGLYLLYVGIFTPAVIFTSAAAVFALLHNLFIFIAAKSDSEPYTFKSFISDFSQYIRKSFILSFATFGTYALSMFSTGSPALSFSAALSSNIITHYIIQSFAFKKPLFNEVLKETEKYISPVRTKIVSFIQRIKRTMQSIIKTGSFKDFVNLYRSPSNITKIVYENSLSEQTNDIVIRTADNADNYYSAKRNIEDYYSNGIIPITFTRYEYIDIGSLGEDFLPVMTAENAEGKSSFRVYINVSEQGIDFFVKVISFSGINIEQAYAMAYAQLLKEIKEGVLNPAGNKYMNAALNTKNIDIIAVESDLGFNGNKSLSSYSDNIYEMKDFDWDVTTNVPAKYKLFSQIQRGAEELRQNFRETETIEKRPFLTGSSIGINIASLSTDRMLGKINDINSFVSVISQDSDFKALNISGYLPFYAQNDWLDNAFIDWAYEAELEGYMDISLEVSSFYESNFALGQNLLNKETLDSMKDFELNIAKKIYARKHSVVIDSISKDALEKYIKDIKNRRIQETISNARAQGISISADYIYDESISYDENIEKVKEILNIFDGITIEIEHDNALNFAESIFYLARGKAVIFKTKEESAEKKTELDIKLKEKFGFRLMRDFIPSENSYGKVISIPVDSVNEKILENLNSSSAVIVELPEVSENIIEQISTIKNGSSILSKLIQSAKGLNIRSVEKSLQDHYLYGVEIVNKTASLKDKKTLKDMLFKDMEFGGIKGRGILVLLQILDRADFDISNMPEMFEHLKIIVSGPESRETEKIKLIIDKLARQFDSAETERKEHIKEMFKHFIYGLYYESEILSLPAFDKYEGEYIERAGNYAADVRKYLYNESGGMKVADSDINASLLSLYSLVSSDMIDIDEIHSLLNYYSSNIERGDFKNIFLLNAVIGQAAYKYKDSKADFKKYSDIFKEQVISYKASSEDKWLHIAALAAIAYIEDNKDIKNMIGSNLDRRTVFNKYSKEEMIMAISLFELLGYDPDSIIIDVSDVDALEQINSDYEIVGLYAKFMKLSSVKLTADQLSVKLQNTIDNLLIEPVKRYVKTENRVKSASIAMALSEISELMGLKIDRNNFEKAVKQSGVLAVKAILAAA